MPYAQRDENGNIIGLYEVPQPDLVPPATEYVPEGTTLTERTTDRILREFEELVAELSEDDRDAVEPSMAEILDHISKGYRLRAKKVIEKIGVLPILTSNSRSRLINKVQELP